MDYSTCRGNHDLKENFNPKKQSYLENKCQSKIDQVIVLSFLKGTYKNKCNGWPERLIWELKRIARFYVDISCSCVFSPNHLQNKEEEDRDLGKDFSDLILSILRVIAPRILTT